MTYFFDSYALIEMFKESPNFSVYLKERITITLLNLIEVTQYFLTYGSVTKAKQVCILLRESVIELSNEDILQAVQFRSENKKKSLSYADCVGYIYAHNHNLLFLTGDDAFKTLKNVAFVK